MESPGNIDFGLHIETSRLQGFLNELWQTQQTILKRQEETTLTLETVLKRLEKYDSAAEEQASNNKHFQESLAQLKDREDELQKLKLPDKLEKLNQHHDMFNQAQALLAQFDAKVKEQEAKISSLEGRVLSAEGKHAVLFETFDKVLNEFSTVSNAQALATQRCEAMETRCVEVEQSQRELVCSVENKYEQLWKGVEKSLESISAEEVRKYQRDTEASNARFEKKMSMQISYCLNILAAAAETNRKNSLKHAVVSRWREQAWLNCRRKMGAAILTRRIHSSMRSCFRRWHNQTRWMEECDRLKSECEQMIPDIPSVLATLVEPRIHSLERNSKEGENKVNALIGQCSALAKQIQNTADRTKSLEDKSNADAVALEQMHDELERHSKFRDSAELRVQKAESIAAHLSEQFSLLAREEDVKNIMKDVLLIWTSVKQLDATKADRRDVDAMAVEAKNREKVVSEFTKSLESHQIEQNGAQEAKLSKLQAMLSESEARQNQSEIMIGLVVQFLEDIAQFQLSQSQSSRPVIVRTGGGWMETRGKVRPVSTIPSRSHAENSGPSYIATIPRSCGIRSPSCNSQGQPEEANDADRLSGISKSSPVTDKISSPTVAAFADWIAGVRHAMEAERKTPDTRNQSSIPSSRHLPTTRPVPPKAGFHSAKLAK